MLKVMNVFAFALSGPPRLVLLRASARVIFLFSTLSFRPTLNYKPQPTGQAPGQPQGWAHTRTVPATLLMYQ